MQLLSVIPFLVLYVAAYSPDTNDDWRLLIPEASSPSGSYSSLPFKFGIIPSPVLFSDYASSQNVVGAGISEDQIAAEGMNSVAEIARSEGILSESEGLEFAEKGSSFGPESVVDSGSSIDSAALDGELQATKMSSYGMHSPHSRTIEKRSGEATSPRPSVPVACISDTVLQLSLDSGILTLVGGRIGSIVSNHQFQFDGPVPQNGAIYAAGWLVTADGLLCLGDKTIFFRCRSGDFYKLFDESIGMQCSPVHLDVIELISC